MGFMKKIWKNRHSENPNRRRLVPTGEANVYDVAREEGLVLEEGDAFSDQTMNDLEERIAAGFDEAADQALTPSEKTKVLGGSNAWVATEVVAQNNAVSFITIPNFVFTENCTVTFKAQVDVPKDEWSCIVINSSNDFVYALRTPIKGVIPAGSWKAGTSVTVTLSTVKIPIGDPQTARMGTAFYSGQQNPLDFSVNSHGTISATDLFAWAYAQTQSGPFITTPSTNVNVPVQGEYLFGYLELNAGVGGDRMVRVTDYFGRSYLCRTSAGVFDAWKMQDKVYDAPAGTTDFSSYANNSFIFVRR